MTFHKDNDTVPERATTGVPSGHEIVSGISICANAPVRIPIDLDTYISFTRPVLS